MDIQRLKHRNLITTSYLPDDIWSYGYLPQEDYKNMKLSSSQLYYVKHLKMLYKQIM